LLELIDIGVNLTNSSFRDRIDSIIEDAKNAGVTHQIITGTCLETSSQALSLAKSAAKLEANYLTSTAGCHPHDAKDFKDSDRKKLIELSTQQQVVAIGECGLDFNRNYSPQDVQIDVFKTQIEVALEVDLPLFMHQRDAHDKFIEILSQSYGQTVKGVIHCFTGDKHQLKQCLDLGLYIGVTGWICDERRGSELQEAIKYMPLDRMMVETDSPYLLPRNIKPKPKSRTNVPANLPWVVKQIASILNLSEQAVAKITTNNAQALFALDIK